MKPSWEATFFEICEVLARRSDDPRTKLGCVIVDEKNRIVSLGYNGLPRGFEPTEERTTAPDKYRWMVHAEQNTILNARGSVEGCTLYVPILPCPVCANTIIQAGIKMVVMKTAAIEEYSKNPGPHMDHAQETLGKFRAAGVYCYVWHEARGYVRVGYLSEEKWVP